MKTKNFSKKLTLNKKTISHLNGDQMKIFHAGGDVPLSPIHVESYCVVCPTWGLTCVSGCVTNCNSDPCCRQLLED
jgi:hypothetical protein